MSLPLNRARPELDPVLAQQFLVHLDAQESALLAMSSLLDDIAREGVDVADKRRFRTRVEAACELCTKLQSDRRHIVAVISQRLATPAETVSIGLLMNMVSADVYATLRDARHRLNRLFQRIQRTLATASWVVAETHEINSMILQALIGVPNSERYDSSGQKASYAGSLRYRARS